MFVHVQNIWSFLILSHIMVQYYPCWLPASSQVFILEYYACKANVAEEPIQDNLASEGGLVKYEILFWNLYSSVLSV